VAATAERLRDESGNALIIVVLVAMLIGALASLALTTGRQAEWSSTSDRNREQSLGVAEAGLHQVISRITAEVSGTDTTAPNYWALTTGQTTPSTCTQGGSCPAAQNDTTGAYKATTPQGTYWLWVTRIAQGFVVDVESKTGGTTLGRYRHIQATLSPPSRFAGNLSYALFSNTSIALQSNDQVLKGNVFANTNISIQNSNATPAIQGSITSATGYIDLQNGVQVTGNVWSGGFNSTASPPWAVNIANGASIGGSVMASATNTGDCASLPNHNYDIAVGSPPSGTPAIGGGATTLGSITGAGAVSVTPPVSTGACTAAAPTQNLQTSCQTNPPGNLCFQFNPANYDPSTYHHFTTVSDFQSWLASNGNQLQGTFLVDPNPSTVSQNNRIDLSTASLVGSTTIVTTAPIYTDGLTDAGLTGGGILFLVSHYAPPPSTSCSTTSNTSECAIHITNSFSTNSDGSCKTATLIYADQGPVAIKNGSNGQSNSGNLCGSVISNGILVKNQETVTYDHRIDNVVGFGPDTYAITHWEELPAH